MARDPVVVDIELREFATSYRFDEGLCASVVNVIVLKLDLFESRTAVDKVAHHEAPLRRHVVLGEVQAMQLLLLLIFEGGCDHSHAFVPNRVTAEVKLADCLAALQHSLEFTQTLNSNVVLFEGEHLQVALLPKGSAQG